MKLFIDVGAHYGETARIALNPKWGFDRVYSLEPSSICRKRLASIRDPRLKVEPFALSNRNDTATLHGSGLLGGSLYADKRQHQATADETIALRRATEWFRETIPEGSTIFLKLNCEGGEADILDDLLDSGEIGRIHRLWVDFDIAKVPSQAHRQEAIERRLRETGVHYRVAERFGFGPQHGIEAWLGWHCQQVPTTLRQRLAYDTPSSAYDAAVLMLKAVLPRRAYWWLGHRFGRLRLSHP